MLIHHCFGTDLQLAFVIRRSGKDFKDKVSPGMTVSLSEWVDIYLDVCLNVFWSV